MDALPNKVWMISMVGEERREFNEVSGMVKNDASRGISNCRDSMTKSEFDDCAVVTGLIQASKGLTSKE